MLVCVCTFVSEQLLTWPGTDAKLKDKVGIKLMHVNNDPEIIKAEADTYKVLAGGVGIPRVRRFGQECDYYALVLELLGPCLEDLSTIATGDSRSRQFSS